MQRIILSSVSLLLVVACIGVAQQAVSDSNSSTSKEKKLFVGQSLDDVKTILSDRKIEFGEGGFAFARLDPDHANLIVVVDKSHAYACVHYSKSRSIVTGLQMVFFPSRKHSLGDETWLPASELQLNEDRTYLVKFSPPITDEELKKLEESAPKPLFPPSTKK